MEHSAEELEDPHAWEARLYETLQIVPAQLPALAELADAYDRLLERHLNLDAPTGRIHPQAPELLSTLVVRYLIFARRTFLIARHLRRHLTPLRSLNSIVERGAGFGPVLLALGGAATGALAAEELFPDYVEGRRRLLRGLKRSPSLAAPPQDLVAYGFSFYEYVHGSALRGVEALSSILDGSPERLILLLAPGDRRHSQLLLEVRDRLAALDRPPIAPCPQVTACPMGKRAQDWCHFTLPATPTPLGARIAAKAKRTSHRLHFSFLLFGPSGQRPHREAARALDVRPQGKSKLVVRLCSSEGLDTLVALARNRPAAARLREVEAASGIRLNPKVERRGDGRRLVDPVDLRFEPMP